MANITMDLDDFNSLMAMGARASCRGDYRNIYNAGRVKAGQPTASGPESVTVSPTNYDQKVDTVEGTTIARVLAAIEAAV
ncbi:hypothetical protein [Streptomyces sp. CCM_MD2014]|uniref:hypothetical protein n=1 Tax=Streptomyces sp. CCM_MD2014 TaxID=1561022 RepID=UPI00052A1B55|nr:hypothetical protein [Streptomyces sp. CCM_MD2014]AIV36417.1 hypothetical protein NI25_25510 [Streptomyces sp. CCM_MD2014]